MRNPPVRVLALALLSVAAACAPAVGAVGDITRFPTPSPGGAFPWDPTVGPDGATWFAATYATDPGIAGMAGRRAARKRAMGATPTSSRLIRVALDGTVTSRGATPFAATVLDGLTTFAGDLWALSSDQRGPGPYRAIRYTTNGTHASFGLGAAGYEPIVGPDGNLWYWLVGGAIGRLTSSGASLPQLAVGGVTVLAPGNGVAWTATNAPALRRVGPDGSTTDIPTPSQPSHIAASDDGFVWYSDTGSNAIGRMAPNGNVVETNDLSRSPTGIAVSPDGIAWVTDSNAGRIYRVSPSLSIETLTVPDAAATASPIIGSDGNLWFQYAHTGGGYYFGRVLTGVIPVNTAGPVAAGRVASGQSVTTGDGQWRYAPTRFAYQWQRCDGDNPNTCANIPGSTSASHAVAPADLDRGLRVLVTATNLNGASAAVASNVLTSSSPPATGFTVGRPSRKGYVISTVVGVAGPGTISQLGTVQARSAKSELARKRKSRAVRACAPRAVAMPGAGTRTIRCVLSPRVRGLLAATRQVVVLKTTFVSRAGGRTTVTSRVTVPRIAKKR